MLVELIKPAPKHEELFDAEQLYAEWRKAHEEADTTPPVQNIRFAHNPHWRTETTIFSLEAAKSRKGIWKPVSYMFYSSLTAFTAISTYQIIGIEIAIPVAVLACYKVIRKIHDRTQFGSD